MDTGSSFAGDVSRVSRQSRREKFSHPVVPLPSAAVATATTTATGAGPSPWSCYEEESSTMGSEVGEGGRRGIGHGSPDWSATAPFPMLPQREQPGPSHSLSWMRAPRKILVAGADRPGAEMVRCSGVGWLAVVVDMRGYRVNRGNTYAMPCIVHRIINTRHTLLFTGAVQLTVLPSFLVINIAPSFLLPSSALH